MEKKVTLQMIASRVGVSVVTVSNVLAGRKGVSESMRSQILSTAEEMGYRRSASAEKKKTREFRFGVIIAERYVKEYPSFYMDIYKKIAQEALKRSCLTILQVVGEAEENMKQQSVAFEYADIQGIMIIGEMNPAFVDNVREKVCHSIVCVDFYDIGKDMDFIITDSYRGMQKVTQRLIDLGHRDIAFVGTPEATGSIMDRYMGYCKALFINGISKSAVIYDREREKQGEFIDFELPEPLPTAFACNCEYSTHRLMEKLRSRGYRVPEDVSVVSFDCFLENDEEGLEFTAYETDGNAIAAISVKTIIRRIEGKTSGIRMVEGRVKEGNTTGESYGGQE